MYFGTSFLRRAKIKLDFDSEKVFMDGGQIKVIGFGITVEVQGSGIGINGSSQVGRKVEDSTRE